MNKITIIAAAAAVTGLMPALASAETISMEALSLYGRELQISYDDGVTETVNRSVTAGRFTWRSLTDNSIHDQNDEFTSFCIELTQQVDFEDSTDYEIAALTTVPSPNGGLGAMSEGQAAALSALVANFWEIASTGGRTKASAFQLAAWEIVYEGDDVAYGDAGDLITGLSVSDGWFQSSGHEGSANLANTWLASLVNNGIAAGIVGYTSTSAQDQIGLSVVPLPAPIAMAAVGLVGVAAIRRRRLARG